MSAMIVDINEFFAHPVGQPLLVIVALGALNGLDGEVSGEDPADNVGNGLSEAEDVEEDKDNGATRVPRQHSLR